MVKVKVNGKEYRVQTRWEEVDPCRLSDCADFRAEIACLTDIPADLINRASETSLFPIYTLISFIHECETMPAIQAFHVEREPYEKMEIAKMELTSGHKPYRKLLNVAMLYYPKEKDSVRLIGLGINIISQIAVFLEGFDDMIHAEPDEEEANAGISDLSMFGAWGTAFVLAGKDPIKVKAVLQLPAIEVYTALYYSWKESKYQKELIKARTKK